MTGFLLIFYDFNKYEKRETIQNVFQDSWVLFLKQTFLAKAFTTMLYSVKLIDQHGRSSPDFDCEIFCDGSEFEIDAELSYEYIKTARIIHVISENRVLSEHTILGYSFVGDTIISGVHAARYGKYVLTVSSG